MRRISVGDVMTRNVITASPESSLHACAKLMAKENISALPVTIKKRLIGIITAGDIFRAITKNPGMDLRKEKCMGLASKKIAVLKPSMDISQAIEKMKSLGFRRLPVISNGELLGVVTLKDILSVEPSLYVETENFMDEIKEAGLKESRSSKEWPLEGLCDNCGAFSELLNVEGKLLCIDCREELD
jgi:CBS domain-containing protein